MYSRHVLVALSMGFSMPSFPAVVSALGEKVAADPATALKPINVLDFEAATGVQRRAAEDFSHLDLGTQAQLVYGRPGNDGQLLLANMTLYAPDGLHMVMMERFEPLTSAVDCNGDDGSMSLTFKSQDAYRHALGTWGFINKAPEDDFLLIANHDGCGPDDERQSYLITEVREEAATLTTHLTAEKKPWSEIAGTYDLDFGKASMPKGDRQKRGIFDNIGNTVSNIADTAADTVTGSGDYSKSVVFPVNVGTPGEEIPIVSSGLYDTTAPLSSYVADNLPSFSLTCLDCYVAGSFAVTGSLSVHHFSLESFILSSSPQDFAAKLELGTTITAPYSPDSLNYTKELFKAPIPSAGLSVPGIFSLGAIASYEVGVSSTFKGSASMNFGISASLPNTALAVADVKNPSQSSATGFEGAIFDPSFDLTALSASMTVRAFAQPRLSFGVDITGVGELEVGINLKLPVVEATIKAAYDEAGLCSKDAGASKTGAQLTSDVGVQVDAGINAELGEKSVPGLAFVLFKKTQNLYSNCFPISIPSINPTSNRTANAEAMTVPSGIPVVPSGVAAVPTTLRKVPSASVSVVAVEALANTLVPVESGVA